MLTGSVLCIANADRAPADSQEAKKHIEPAVLTVLQIQLERALVKPGAHVASQVEGFDQHGRPMPVPKVQWTVAGGTGDAKVGSKAGQEEGEFLVEATAGDLCAQATVVTTRGPPPPQPELNVRPVRPRCKGGEDVPKR